MNNLIPFQWSIKLDTGEIYVCQTETSEELGLAIEEIKSKFLGKKAVVDDSTASEMCPKCGSPLIMSETKTGKKFQKCATNKWDFERKQSIGCDYVNWKV